MDHDEAETPFSIVAPERTVALTEELLVMYASHRLWLVHMLIPGSAVSLLHGRKFAKGRHFLDSFRRFGGVCKRRHLARAAETAEKKG